MFISRYSSIKAVYTKSSSRSSDGSSILTALGRVYIYIYMYNLYTHK